MSTRPCRRQCVKSSDGGRDRGWDGGWWMGVVAWLVEDLEEQ